MTDTLIVVPTYDEKNNVRPLTKRIFEVVPECRLLFVDDNSPDGTGPVIDEICAQNKRVSVLHRPGKEGLGRAYIAGFKWALAHDFDLIVGMDADFSHDPAELPVMIETAGSSDLVIGSRYINGIRITNWPLHRLLLSKGAATYVRLITGMPVHDPTGGYRAYRRQVLEAIDLDRLISDGYAFLVEMAHRTWIQGFRITEIPITFEDRRSGYSKMSFKVFVESFCLVWKLAFRCGFRRSPRPRKTGGDPK